MCTPTAPRVVRVWAGWVEPDRENVASAHGAMAHLESDKPPTVRTLPDDPVARGQWLCLELVLRSATWLWLPPTLAVQWPDGTEQLRERALGDGGRFVALRQRDVHEVQR